MLVALAEALAASGRAALLYNFPYAEAGSRRPDPPAVLEATTRAAAALALGESGARRIVHGGRSMGGRIASQVVAAGERADGLAFLAYPLHPPGQSEQLRDAHLPQDRGADAVRPGHARRVRARRTCSTRSMERLGSRAELHRVEHADHSFGVLKRSGRTPRDVLDEITAVLLALADAPTACGSSNAWPPASRPRAPSTFSSTSACSASHWAIRSPVSHISFWCSSAACAARARSS